MKICIFYLIRRGYYGILKANVPYKFPLCDFLNCRQQNDTDLLKNLLHCRNNLNKDGKRSRNCKHFLKIKELFHYRFDKIQDITNLFHNFSINENKRIKLNTVGVNFGVLTKIFENYFILT